MTLVVILTVRSEAVERFRAFERRAAAVMARHGGAIERTVVVPPARPGDCLREVHVVTFPGEIAPLRDESVVGTEVLVGEDGPDYGPGR
jgi:hypothetical protein